MKSNLNYFIGIFFACILCFSACSKDEPTETMLPATEEYFILDNVPSISNPNDLQQYLTNPNDEDDEKINQQLLDIAIATRDYLKETPQNQFILNRASKSANSSVNLFELASKTSLKSANNNQAYSRLAAILASSSLTHRSTNPLKSGEVEQYIPGIYVPNIEIADFNKQPIICPGFEVNAEIGGMEEYEDYIVGWYYEEPGNLKEILLNEETAMNTTNPVFIVHNAEEALTNLDKSSILRKNPSSAVQNEKSTEASYGFSTNEFKINYRYEGSGRSEFCITAAHIDENGTAHNILYDGGYTTWKKIREVEKDEIGDQLGHWEQFCSIEVLPFGDNYGYFNTFERDWYQSKKDLGSATNWGTTIYLGGNMKYNGDWYAIDPNDLSSNPVDYSTIYYSWAKWYENYKGNIRFWRVQ